MWRSVGFLMSFAVVLEGMTILSYIVIISGGKKLRETGWSVLSLFLILAAGVQAASMSTVVSREGQLSFISGHAADILDRPTCTTTMTASLSVGSWMNPGFSAP